MQKHFFFHSVFVLITLRETMRALRKSLNLSGQISFIDHQKKICMYLCFDFVMEILFKKKIHQLNLHMMKKSNTIPFNGRNNNNQNESLKK